MIFCYCTPTYKYIREWCFVFFNRKKNNLKASNYKNTFISSFQRKYQKKKKNQYTTLVFLTFPQLVDVYGTYVITCMNGIPSKFFCCNIQVYAKEKFYRLIYFLFILMTYKIFYLQIKTLLSYKVLALALKMS